MRALIGPKENQASQVYYRTLWWTDVQRPSLKMYGRRATDLIRGLDRAAENSIPPYNGETVRAVCEEIKDIFEANQQDTGRLQSQADTSSHQNILHSIHFRHIAMERNKRCLVAYHYNRAERLRSIRWNLGGIIPREIRSTLSEKEVEWFNSYNTELTNYMMELDGLNLTVHQRPPKEHFIHIMETTKRKMVRRFTSRNTPATFCQGRNANI
ncbi:hypothetical protein RvY_07379-2 [Ramazzottius varieornatus]|uniref:DNA replication complex GINS protein PSF1 n=1 Tax=Ramazzottius varieornatus TaxID=947166 RepID=A0A1D1V1Y7_RAMVA|nr:hypothetical protein RvY_07379-2 [Ramazzottius varieornatus]